MKSKFIALAVFVAVAAFVLGLAVSSPKIDTDVSTAALLEANLLEVVALGEEPQSTTIKSKLGDLTVVNFWATWCTPCREEMPMFEAVYSAMQDSPKSFQIIGVTIDSTDKALPMLDSMAITYPVVFAELTGNELMATVGNPQGFLPFTVVLDKEGRLLEQKVGRVHEDDVTRWINTFL